MADPAPAAQQGQVLKKIAGFELIEKVGQGGMGAVFKARQVSLDRVVALKVLPPSIAKNKEFTERFLREARAAGRLNHPHIVQGIDVGVCEKTGLYYFAMEFVDGPPLGRAVKESGAFPEDYVRKVAQQMGEALDYAHQNGVVHRDIKPDNILMNSQGMAKLADLGLAKQLHKQEDASLTQAGIAVGTPFYMAPEQVRGQVDKIDTRTDLYSLGATLFHLVTGQTPFKGATNAVIMAAHLNDKIPLAHQINADVSEGFSRLLVCLLQKEQDRRPANPRAFLEMLERVDEVGGTTRRAARGIRGTTGPRDVVRATTGPRERIRTTTGPRDSVSGAPGVEGNGANKSHTVLYFAVGLAVAVLLGGGILALALGGRKEEPRRVAVEVKKEEPAKPVPVPDPVPVKAPPPKPLWNAAGAFENAQRMATQNPDDIRGAYRLFQGLLEEAEQENASDIWLEKIRKARDEAKARYDERMASVRADLEAKVKDAREQHAYDAALRAIEQFPAPDDEAERDRLKELGEALRAEAEGVLNPLLDQTKAALAEGRLDDAEAALKKAAGVAYEPAGEQVAALRAQLEEARVAAQQKAEEEARALADAGWEKLLNEFDAAVLTKSDFEMMRVILKTARDDRKLEPRKEDVALLDEVGRSLLALVERERKAFETLKGQKVVWEVDGKPISGRIKSVEDGTIDLLVTIDRAEMVRKLKVTDLRDEDRAKLLPALEPDGPVQALAAAVLKLMEKAEDRAAAKRFLASAGDSALALHYRNRFREAASDDKETAAAEAWRGIMSNVGEGKVAKARMEEFRAAIEEFKKTHGQTQFAADNQQAIAALLEKVTSDESGTGAEDSVTADRLVMWNLHGNISYAVRSRGTTRADVVLYLKDRPLWQARDIRLVWKSASNVPNEIALPKINFDRIRVFATNYAGTGAGFSEIQVFKGEENIALGRQTKVSASEPENPGSHVVDGKTHSGDYNANGWQLPAREKGWIEIDFSKPASKAAPAHPPKEGGQGEQGGVQGGWKTPLEGDLRVDEDGRIGLRGPGNGDAGCAIAVPGQDPGKHFTVDGHFRRRGPFAGFIVGYDPETQRFISFYSRKNDGIDMYVHTGGERKLWKHVPEVVIGEEWTAFRITQRDRDITIEMGGKAHAFKLPEDWPAGRRIGLITHFESSAQIGRVRLTPMAPGEDGPPPPPPPPAPRRHVHE